ncbi:MAG: hypothetical protein H6625_03320 [Bdellovibrionaceae bacterium]|nr:hypothetical protein [Pseudobdellovibrionaceae bacterium]
MFKRSIIFLFLIFTQSVWAQEPLRKITNIELQSQDPLDEKLPDGWHPSLKIKANVSVGSSKSVVGQTDGDSNTMGGKLEAALIFKELQNEWRQSLNYSGATTKTASLPRYVKTSDELKYSTIFLRSLKSYPMIGPYARAEARTSVFKGEDVRSENKTYVIQDTSTNLGIHNTYRLTDPFIPLTTQGSVGFFAKILERKKTQLEVRFGLGAINVKTDKQLRLKDDSKTEDIIELSVMNDLSQVGFEYGVIFKGKWNEASEYSLTADFLTPMGTEIAVGKECYGCNNWGLTNIDFKVDLSTKVCEWMNITYEYKALRQPQVLDDFQIQHGFVLTFFYDIINNKGLDN